MAKKIFIAATGQNCGKSTTSLSLIHLARQHYSRVGFVKPIGPKPINHRGVWVDKDAALIAGVFGLEDDLELMSPVVLQPDSTRQALDGKISMTSFEARIRDAVSHLESRCDFLVIEGSGHGGVGSVVGLSNARVAKLLNAPVMIVSQGGVGNAIDAISLNLALYRQEGVEVRVVLANKLLPAKRERCLHYLNLAFADAEFVVAGGFNYSPILANPTLARIAKILESPLLGDARAGSRIVHHVHLGAASSQRVVDLLDASSLLLVNSSRDELLVTLSSLYHLAEYRRRIAGLVIPGYTPISPVTQKILDGSHIPYIRTPLTNAEAFSIIKDDVSKLTAEDREKIDLIRTMAESELDFDAIDALL
ncbi:MAG TPA: AAA family ATPase [Desulfuromonadales bacterium]|nr:AAA family ATPase [Desulfuromonadales bacterium]